MTGPSTYVHSNAENADLSVNVSVIDNINGIGDFEGQNYISSTLNKLESIARELDRAADEFLSGYSLDAAQAIADNADEFLGQIANRILYGQDSYEMVNTLTRNQKIKSKDLIKQLQGKGGIADEIVKYLIGNKEVTINELTSFIAKTFSRGQAKITVSEASAQIVELGGLFDVQTVNTTFRKETELQLTDQIFRNGKDLITGRRGAYRNLIKDLIKSSNYRTIQSAGSAINSFCNKLHKKMLEEANKEIAFEWGADKDTIDNSIDNFIQELNTQLKKILNPNKMLDSSNVRGAIGEEVRESISKAGNSVIYSLHVGDLTEEALVKEMEQSLKEEGAINNLSKMKSFHTSGKMSQTDLILINRKTKTIARAQSKNHFASYFTNNNIDQSSIDNFRWKVEDAVNLANFIQNLAKNSLGFGISLNDFDIDNVLGAIANNVWQSKYGTVYSEGGTLVHGGKSGIDFKAELEGSIEKLLAGQVVNLLGVTLQSTMDKVSIEAGASNIFYILNGRLKRTSELVREAINQIKENELKTLTDRKGRLVNVTLSNLNLSGIDTYHFLGDKLKAGSYNGNEFRADQGIGEAKGEEILNNIRVTVSLGTSIDKIMTSSFVF